MADCSSCASKASCGKKQDTCGVQNSKNNQNIKKVYGVLSGKGGVGKSTMSVLIAKQLQRQGLKVGILDADITGPSIPRLLGVEAESAYGTEDGILPIVDKDGIKMMSVNNMVGDESAPLIWRGAMISKLLGQLWNDVIWGELDVLLIDMPPGTGDVALTVMQTMRVDGIIMVSIPQDMVSMIVGKAINMCKQLQVPLLGVIQNMAYVSCPDCNTRIDIFNPEGIEAFLAKHDIALLAELPMISTISQIHNDHTFTVKHLKTIDTLMEPVTQHLLSLQ
ncbi:MAG: Mrp/NBP35 family ATP-binding protein [Erysipelotrichaceae bacterium]